MNKAIIIGRLTKNPEIKITSSGTSVCSFTVAVDRQFKNQNGEKETDFIPVVVWRGLADTCGKYLDKGKMVAISGRIQTRSYDAKDGSKRYITEIVADEVEFLTPKSDTRHEEIPGFTEIEDEDEMPF